MPQVFILYPLLVQVFLTFGVLLVLGGARRRSMHARRQSVQSMALATDKDWDEDALKASNNYKNQFELPVLFYAGCIVALQTHSVDYAVLGLAWAFVATRVAHAVVHLGSNRVVYRGSAFLLGFVALLAMWIIIAVRVLSAGQS